jgi:hypothetical protein
MKIMSQKKKFYEEAQKKEMEMKILSENQEKQKVQLPKPALLRHCKNQKNTNFKRLGNRHGICIFDGRGPS